MKTDTSQTRGSFVDVKVGDTLTLHTGGVDSKEITLTLHRKHGQVARVQVQAPESVRIARPAKRPG
jgi:sRNA-binding carbon storage regulator CsrA